MDLDLTPDQAGLIDAIGKLIAGWVPKAAISLPMASMRPA